MIGAFMRIAGWMTRARMDDPLVLSNLNDISDLLDAIRQGLGW